MNIEERLERLESFIGNVDEIRLYANSLQEVLDRYLAPLYIEMGSGNIMLVDGYLGDLENIPHNVIFKIRASHDLLMTEGEHAIIRFQRGTEHTDYTLRKLVEKRLEPLDNANYTDGEVYDIYINSQDIAVITANDTGTRALAELSTLRVQVESALGSLNATVNNNYVTLDTKINTTASENRTYTDTKTKTNTDAIANINSLLSGITKNGNNYVFTGDIYASYIEAQSLKATRTVNLSSISGFVLPSGTTIADPSSNLAIANMQWVNNKIQAEIDAYHALRHIANTIDPSVALAGSDKNGSFYYKLSQ